MMKARTVATTVAVTLGVLGVLTAAGPARAAAPPAGVDHIAHGGFGDYRNSYSWSMGWFKGKLYVGTARQQACFENLTIDYYLPVLEQYKNGAFPGVTCPADPWDMDLRAEIWEYTPQTRTWKRVFRSSTVANPEAAGKR